MKYTDPSGHSWLSKQWEKLKKWTKKNWRNIAGAVLIVAGAVATYYGFEIIGIPLMNTGVSLIKYNPNEPDSPTNEIRVDVGTNGTPPINFDFNGDFQNQYTQDNDQGKYIVNNVTQGTHSTTTGNKFSNGGDSATYNGTVGYDISYNPNSGGNVLGVDRVDAWDLNNDGRLSYRESINWWKNGNGVSIVIRNASYLQTQRTGFNHKMNNGKSKYSAFVLGIDNYMVHGQVQVNPANGHIYDGLYNFEMHGTDRYYHLNDGIFGFRDRFTQLGALFAGKGQSYWIKYRYPE